MELDRTGRRIETNYQDRDAGGGPRRMAEHGTEAGVSPAPGDDVALEGGSGPEPLVPASGALTRIPGRAVESQE